MAGRASVCSEENDVQTIMSKYWTNTVITKTDRKMAGIDPSVSPGL